MTADPAFVLDVTRLISRLGQGPLTGIDRVEAAWLAHLQDRPHHLVARLGPAQMLLGPDAGADLLRWTAGDKGAVPAASLLDRILGQTALRPRAKRAMARRAVARVPLSGRGIARRLHRIMPGRPVYLNVGHSNLGAPWLDSLGHAALRIVLIHDTIPLDHPDLTRPGQDAIFRDRLTAALSHADIVVAISAATRDDLLRWRDRLGIRSPAPIVVAPIGTTRHPAVPADLPPDLELTRPFLVVLGTIEPRKNHALLLDAWQLLAQHHVAAGNRAADLPQLLIVGRRGWENAATFARLDALPPGGPVRELPSLPDGAVAALLDRAHALLLPSLSEGFGLPLTEAACRGTPILCTPLPTARALLGDYPIYLPADDPRPWTDAIARITKAPRRPRTPLVVPGWAAHFRRVEDAAMQAFT